MSKKSAAKRHPRGVCSISRAPEEYRGLAASPECLWIHEGEHVVVDGRFAKNPDAIQATEIVVGNGASVHASGHVVVRLVQNGKATVEGEHCEVYNMEGGELKALDCTVIASMQSTTEAKNCLMVAESGTPSIFASGGTAIIVSPRARPGIEKAKTARVFRSTTQGPRALSVADATAPV